LKKPVRIVFNKDGTDQDGEEVLFRAGTTHPRFLYYRGIIDRGSFKVWHTWEEFFACAEETQQIKSWIDLSPPLLVWLYDLENKCDAV